MELPLKELSNLLNNSQHVLLTGPQDPSIDVLCSAAAWRIFLLGQNKQADIVLSGQLPKIKFLPADLRVEQVLEDLNKFKIILDLSRSKVKQLSYDIQDDNLVIDILPQDGQFQSSDVHTTKGDYKYDLIITLGAINREALGATYQNNRQFFQSVPLVNIDRQILNENFGQLNILESTATSLAEICYFVLQKHLNKDIATCLLGGLIAATNSFQSSQVTPQVLDLASQLIVKGAERQRIIEDLYRTKDIQTLKNWGRILSRLQKKENILFSYLQHNELENVPQDLQELVRDLILSTPQAQVAIIFYQLDFNQTEVWLYTINNINALDLTKDVKGEGQRYLAKFIVGQGIDEARRLVVEKIQEKLKIINSF